MTQLAFKYLQSSLQDKLPSSLRYFKICKIHKEFDLLLIPDTVETIELVFKRTSIALDRAKIMQQQNLAERKVKNLKIWAKFHSQVSWVLQNIVAPSETLDVKI